MKQNRELKYIIGGGLIIMAIVLFTTAIIIGTAAVLKLIFGFIVSTLLNPTLFSVAGMLLILAALIMIVIFIWSVIESNTNG